MKSGLNYKRILSSSVMLALLLGISIGCKKSSTSTPGPNEVWMQNMAYNPLSITVSVNTTVKWTNMDSYAHTVTSGFKPV